MAFTAMIAFLYILAIPCAPVAALHARWIPNGDKPLPMSEEYRSKLRRLCTLIEKGKKLPPKLATRKRDIVSQCRKLADADSPSTWQPFGFGADGGLPGWLRWGIFIAIALFLLSHFHAPRIAGPNHDLNWARAWGTTTPKPPRSMAAEPTAAERRRRRELAARSATARFAAKPKDQ